jgi:hypothetical protein
MPLRRTKMLYCIIMIAIGVLLAANGSLIYWLTSVLVLSGALPGWRIITRAASDQGADEALSVVEHRLQQ